VQVFTTRQTVREGNGDGWFEHQNQLPIQNVKEAVRRGSPAKGIFEEKEIVLGVIRNENIFRFSHTPQQTLEPGP